MKKVIAMILMFLLVGSAAYVYFYQFQVFTSLEDTQMEIKVLEKEQAQDKVLSNKLVKGKTIYNGGPYRLGDTVYVQDKAVTLEKVGIRKDLKETGSTHGLPYAIFKMHVYNYGIQPYTVSPEDVILTFEESKGTKYEQPASISGYEVWKKIKGSFILGEIEGKTMRAGYIFFPIKENGREDGNVRIFINNVPVDFKY